MELIELAALVDEYNATRHQRLLADKEAAALKKEEKVIHDRIIDVMFTNDTYVAAGQQAVVRLQQTEKPIVEDWVSYYNYMTEHDAMDLLQKRVHESALKDRLEAGEEVPGVTFVEVNKLSIGKINVKK